MKEKKIEEKTFTVILETPLGKVQAAAQEDAICGLWFIGQKYFPAGTEKWINKPGYPVFASLKAWLKDYFAEKNPEITFKLSPAGTVFQQSVWKLLKKIPYGKTTTYGAIAEKLKEKKAPGGEQKFSEPALAGARPAATGAQAVGGAVGHNPVSILIPCHRVLGADGSLTGYAGGLDRKCALLGLEKGNIIKL